MNAGLAARMTVLEEMFEALVELIKPLEPACLNWAPAPGANSIADMVTHIIGSLESWLARALNEPFERNREAEFEAQATAVELLTLITAARPRLRARFDRLDSLDLGTLRQVQRLSRGQSQAVTIAWCIDHAVIHAGEHWGQIQLNRELFPLLNPPGR